MIVPAKLCSIPMRVSINLHFSSWRKKKSPEQFRFWFNSHHHQRLVPFLVEGFEVVIDKILTQDLVVTQCLTLNFVQIEMLVNHPRYLPPFQHWNNDKKSETFFFKLDSPSAVSGQNVHDCLGDLCVNCPKLHGIAAAEFHKSGNVVASSIS